MACNDPTIDALLNRFSPSGEDLLEWLKPIIDDSCLWDIAHADFGFNEDEYFQALVPIRDHQEIPAPLRWFPREALQLTSYRDPDNPKFYAMIKFPPSFIPKTTGERGHWIRFFCCAVLLKAVDDVETRDYITDTEENGTLIPFVVSALRLGPEATRHAMRFLCWRLARLPSEYADYPYFVMALLLLRVRLHQSGEDSSDLVLLADWVVAEEARTRSSETWRQYSDEWLLGLNSLDSTRAAWRRVTWNTLLDPAKAIPELAASALRGIAERIPPKQIVLRARRNERRARRKLDRRV